MTLEVKNPNDLPTLSIKDLIPTQGDLKDLTEANYNKLKLSFEKHGFIFPISIWQDGNKNYLIDGHQRQRVIVKEYGDAEVPVIKIPAKDINEAAEILLKVTSQYGTITQEGLDTFIAQYELPEVEIYEATHYDAISYLQSEEPEVEEDEAPEVSSEPPVSKLGEVYQLGRHKVMCGDSTDRANVELLMNGVKADMVFTDPPYGIKAVSTTGNVGGGGNPSDGGYAFGGAKNGTIGGNNKAKAYSEIIGDDTTDTAKEFYNITTDLEFYNQVIFGGNYFTDFLPPRSCWVIWDKENTGNFADVEIAWTSFDKGAKLYKWLWNGLSRKGDRTAELVSRVHPTQKPVGLIAEVLKDFTERNHSVLDGFLGSGSTLIACEQTDRTCYGMELDPKYVDVIRKRYAKFTAPDNQLPENWEELTPTIKGE